jgi:crotonobetainyl-CoA:carnitine CoA-transferase CaiB-like acyl-CoA transferase
LGADCIKVEWHAHPDTRLGAGAPVGGREARRNATGPLTAVDDPDMGGNFNHKNAGKRGISLNVRHPEGLEIARELVRQSDIVAEGFSPGVMERWGLGYSILNDLRPGIIYAQQSGMGGAGTYGRTRAVGPIAAALAGLTEMSGAPDPAPPAGWGYSYLDWMGAYSFATAILAALFHRNRTGEGQFIDASQCEAGIFGTALPILDWQVNKRPWRRVGNRSPYLPAAPEGVYRCAGNDRWVAISCPDEDSWSRLVSTLDRADLREDERLATLEGRVRHADLLDAVVESWTATRDPYDVMHRLQAAGVAAGVCQTAEDRCEHDPQLAELGWLTEVTGTKIGTWPVGEYAVTMSETPGSIAGRSHRGAPCYGEDNYAVFKELLGFSEAEIDDLAARGVI